jgi:HSP20 family protein
MSMLQRNEGTGENALSWPFEAMDRFLGGAWAPSRADWAPPMDIVESEKDYELHLELPGVDPKAVEITVQDGVLTVSGEKKSARTEKGEGWTRSERRFGSFSRSVTLPEGTDAGQVTAEAADGVFVVRIPKPEARAARKIQVTRK